MEGKCRFFYAAADAGSGDGGDDALACLFADLIGGGFGRDHREIAERLTWRQIRRFSQALAQRRASAQADLIEGIAVAIGSTDLPDILKRLRGL